MRLSTRNQLKGRLSADMAPIMRVERFYDHIKTVGLEYVPIHGPRPDEMLVKS